ncbi:MAG: DUF1292 domain-containing protein [Clostridia bacterium]|nr:DUF1292 domain-containing protein [Clostridia bacterium]MBQ5999915.1 DUF1292 domain-containing protein [Clostridia bacterium]
MSEEKTSLFDGDLITLIDEDGAELQYEHLDTLEYAGAFYLALVPIYDSPQKYVDADGELQIMKVVEENGEQILCTIDNEDEFDAVACQFEDRLSEEFDIIN